MQVKPTQVVGRRVGAFLIDTLILTLISAAGWFALTSQLDGPCFGGGVEIGGDCRGFTEGSNQTLWTLINILASIIIFWIIQGLTGKTPGKAAVGIKTVNAEGNAPGIPRAALRSILAIVDAFPYLIPYLTGFIVALNSERNQRVGDMAANTFVVDKNAAAPSGAGAGALGGGQQGYGSPGGGGGAFGGPPQYASAPQPPQSGGAAADWYPDPQGQARLRYWDGQRWTEHTSQ